MKILAFDTCLDKMYVALGDNGKIVDSKIIETTKSHYHSAFLISTIKKILKANSLTPENIDAIATNIGPGSFTGIRACTTVARVFAQAKNIKTIGISSLEILSRITSESSSDLSIQQYKTLVALDARKEMAYVAIFENKKQILAPQTILIEDLKELISKDDYEIITDDKMGEIITGTSYQQTDKDLGKILIEIATEKINENVGSDWKNLHPLYIQPPPVGSKK